MFFLTLLDFLNLILFGFILKRKEKRREKSLFLRGEVETIRKGERNREKAFGEGATNFEREERLIVGGRERLTEK